MAAQGPDCLPLGRAVSGPLLASTLIVEPAPCLVPPPPEAVVTVTGDKLRGPWFPEGVGGFGYTSSG